MAEIVAIVILILLFLGIMFVFSKEKLDYVGYALLAAVIGVIKTVYFVTDIGNGIEVAAGWRKQLGDGRGALGAGVVGAQPIALNRFPHQACRVADNRVDSRRAVVRHAR